MAVASTAAWVERAAASAMTVFDGMSFSRGGGMSRSEREQAWQAVAVGAAVGVDVEVGVEVAVAVLVGVGGCRQQAGNQFHVAKP